jgi:hypothetical protein
VENLKLFAFCPFVCIWFSVFPENFIPKQPKNIAKWTIKSTPKLFILQLHQFLIIRGFFFVKEPEELGRIFDGFEHEVSIL